MLACVALSIQISYSMKENVNNRVNKPAHFTSGTNLHHQLFTTNELIWLRSECG